MHLQEALKKLHGSDSKKQYKFLILHINRFSNLAGSKITTTVWPNDVVTFPSGDEYKLCGIGHHIGQYFSSGHFVASVRDNDQWITYNDTEFSMRSESDSKSMECNVCIYSKVMTCHTPFIPTDEWQNARNLDPESS